MEGLRNSGLNVVGPVPWGTHFCQFYKTEHDLLDVLVPYFKAGLENGEFCIWVTSEPLRREKAIKAMSRALPDFDKYLKKGQIEILPHSEWYLKGGDFKAKRVLNAWVKKLHLAISRGYEGLRLTGNTFWLEKKDWRRFTDYESEIQKIIGQYRMIALCTYSLDKCGVNEVIDVISNHKFALIMREGKWSQIESSGLKSAERALIESEERIRVALKHSPIAVSTQDKELRYLWLYNPHLGSYDMSLIGKTDGELFTPDDSARLTKIKRRVLDTGVGAREEIGLTVRGDVRYYDFTIEPWRDMQGRVVGINCAAVDITERKKIEEELRTSRVELELRVQQRTADLLGANELLESFFSSTNLLIAYMNEDFSFIRVNRAYAEADGRTPDFFVGKNHFDLYPNKENERIFRRVVKTGEPYSVYEKPFKYAEHPEKGITYWDWRLHPLKGEDGKVNRLVLILINATDRKLAEQERLRLAAAVDQASESIAITDKEGIIFYVNPAFEAINGYSRQEVLGKKYEDLLESSLLDEGLKENLQDIISRGDQWSGHIRRRKRNGQVCELDVAISPVREQSGKILNYSVVERDVSQEVQLQRHIRQMQKMEALGTLAGGVAHDFNNILMTVGINAELALLSAQEGSPLHHYLQLVLEAVSRGKELVKQVITFSRQKEQEMKPIKIAPIIKEALKFLRSSLPSYIEIRDNITTESDIVMGDPTQIYQVVMNLCNNAAYAMRDEGGVLSISLDKIEVDSDMAGSNPDLKPGPHLKLTFSDTGRGMDQEIIPRIFDPFFTTKKPGEGAGMGLAVVHGIIRSHRGTISVYSELGKGSTFNIFLPQAKGYQVLESGKSGPILKGNERILLVDDEEAQVRGVQHMLEKLGYRVTVKTDSNEALKVFKAEPEAFDLVITDQIMPQMTGAKLAEALMKIRRDLPVILCTGFSEVMGVDEAKAIGIREFVMKPYTAQEIAGTIRRVMGSE